MSQFSLSPSQEARWRLAQHEPPFPWTTSLTLALHGKVEPDAVRAALGELVQRHEILRTRFVTARAGAAPVMTVERAGQASFESLDWSQKTLVERELECRRLEAALRAPYPLDGAAPLRAALARVGAEEHVLVLAQSALAADWRSLWSLARELARALAGELESEPPVQFADLAQWLRDTLAGPDAEAGLEAWREPDLGAAAGLRLPLEHEHGPAQRTLHELSRELPPRMQESLEQLASARRIPVEAFLCAVWQAWLARLAELPALVIGVHSAGRAFQGLDHALGTFERALPVAAQIDERVSLVMLARRTDEQLARGAEWHEFFQPERPARVLAHREESAPRRTEGAEFRGGMDEDRPAGSHSLDPRASASSGLRGAIGSEDFAFRYAFEHLPLEADHEHGGLRLEVVRRDGHGEPFRGCLRVEHTSRGCELRFAFDARWFGEAEAGAVADPYLALLESALARPEAPLASLSALSPAERARLLELARGPELAPRSDPVLSAPGGRCIHEWILETARQRPDAPAVRAGGVELSYRALEQRSAALALELEEKGVVPGSLVGVHLERSVELVVALLAVLRAGGAYVPLPPSYPRERVLTMLTDSRAPVVIGSAASASTLAGFRGTFVPVHAPRATAGSAPRSRATPAHLAYVIYTSGSSGTPKGVPITHANLVHSTRARVAVYQRRVERYLLLSSFAFDSSVAGIFWTLVQGGTLVLPPEGIEKDLASLPALIAEQRPTHLLGLPSLWSLVLEQGSAEELASLDTVIVAGESCPAELVRRHRARLPRARLYNEYGPTEGTVWSTVFDAHRPLTRAQVPIGRPIPGSAAYVLTPERELAPLGVAGELWIGGPGVAGGYLNRPELTAERFAEDPFAGGRMYRTGDRARWLPDGNLEFLGRMDGQVKIRGYRIELEEVEAALSAHPAVREAIVIARDDHGSGARLVAYVVPVGPRPAETDLLRFLSERIPEHMVPARAVALDGWPQLPNGKIDRKALPEPPEPLSFAEPEGALEIVLAALFADVLGLEAVGRHDDFFALGGHSLSATRLYARLKETLQVKLPLRALFEHRSPADLAAELARDPAEGERVLRLADVVLSVLEAESSERALPA